jgi:hypothetical protein
MKDDQAKHMMDVHIESLAKLRVDMGDFLDSVTGHSRENSNE